MLTRFFPLQKNLNHDEPPLKACGGSNVATATRTGTMHQCELPRVRSGVFNGIKIGKKGIKVRTLIDSCFGLMGLGVFTVETSRSWWSCVELQVSVLSNQMDNREDARSKI